MNRKIVKIFLTILTFVLVGANAQTHPNVECEVTYVFKFGKTETRNFSGALFGEEIVAIKSDFELSGIPAHLHVAFGGSEKFQLAVNYTHKATGTTLLANSLAGDKHPRATLVAFDPKFIDPELTRLIVDCSVSEDW